MYIDPKDLSLQDAAGMQLANVIRGIPEGSGGAAYVELTAEEGLGSRKLTSTKTCKELLDKDVIIFYTQLPKRTNYYLCVSKNIPTLIGGQFKFVMAWNDSQPFVSLTANNPTDFPTATVQE